MSSFITIRLPRCSTIQLNRYGMGPSVAVSSTLFFFLSIHILEKNHTALVRSLWPLYDDIWSIMIQIQVVSIPQFTQKMKRHFSRESTSLNITAVGANSYIVETRRWKMRRVIIFSFYASFINKTRLKNGL